MSNNLYQQTLASFPKLLKPIIRILLRSGIDFKQFVHYSRRLFVEVATEDYGIDGRKTNISRVSVLTGIGRSNVSKIRKELEEATPEIVKDDMSHASKILHAWHSDPEFLAVGGLPKPLPLESTKGQSLKTLINKYRGDIPETTLLKELIQSPSLELLPNDTVNALSKNYIPYTENIKRAFTITSIVSDLTNTLHYNMLLKEQTEVATGKSEHLIHYASRILTAWHNDPSFVDKNNKPKSLPIVSNKKQSFTDLINQYLPEIEPEIIISQLKLSDSIKVTKHGYIHAKERDYVPHRSTHAYLIRAHSIMSDIINTIRYNLENKTSEQPRFERRALNFHVPASKLHDFSDYMQKKGLEFLIEIDNWLDRQEKINSQSAEPEAAITLGAGVYMVYRSEENGEKKLPPAALI